MYNQNNNEIDALAGISWELARIARDLLKENETAKLTQEQSIVNGVKINIYSEIANVIKVDIRD